MSYLSFRAGRIHSLAHSSVGWQAGAALAVVAALVAGSPEIADAQGGARESPPLGTTSPLLAAPRDQTPVLPTPWVATFSEALSGIRSISIRIDADEEVDGCAVSKNVLRTAAARPLLDSALSVLDSDDLRSPVLQVSLRILGLENGLCVGAMQVSLYQFGLAVPGHQQSTGPRALLDGEGPKPVRVAPTGIVFSDASRLFSTLRARFQDTALGIESGMVDRIVTNVRLANQPR